ncbi:MAG: hypothetical protein KBD63_05045 [Bacteriovoracaceae bacterium]|nr:hypothetical protein [Bacteriovoracaceae bacterium]
MNLVNFKLITIICEPVLSVSILEMSEKFGSTGFTITEVKGEGDGEKNSGEIPDLKLKIEIIVDPKVALNFMESVALAYFKNYSLITYASDISVLRPEKFESLNNL